MNRNDDGELVTLARLGSRAAFGVLIERHRESALSFILRIVADESAARDLMQEATLQAWLSIGSLRSEDAFRAWLCGIALNLCRSHFRKGAARHLSYDSLLERGDTRIEPGTVPDPHTLMESREHQEQIRRAIDSLSPANGDVVLLYYYDRLSIAEIARGLGLSVTAVKGRLFKARGQLRRVLAPLYSEVTQDILTNQRRHPMIPVVVSDLIKSTDDENVPTETYTVILLDESGNRALPIHVGHAEGEAIAWNLLDLRSPRPLTFSFIGGILETTGAELREVRIESLQENIYYASIRLSIQGTEHGLDARPSDALALATRLSVPIYVAAELMDASAVSVSTVGGGVSRRGWGLVRIREELERMTQLGLGAVASGHGERLTRALVEFAFRSGPEMIPTESEGPTSAFIGSIRLAREEAIRLNHVMIDADDLLLGVLAEGEGNAVNILTRLGCDPVDLREAIEADVVRIRNDAQFAEMTELPMHAGRNVVLTDTAERIMKAATGRLERSDEAGEEVELPPGAPGAASGRTFRRMNYHGRHPATDDLLAAMLNDADNAAARLLIARGITRDRIGKEIEALRS